MTQIRNFAEAETVLARYIPQVRELLGKDITLARMMPLMKLLGNPEKRLKIVHVAGTSGKTSTCYYIANLLGKSGKKVGLTVSPHIDSIAERVQINGQPISETEFCDGLSEFLEIIKNADPTPTYFELLIAFAYWYFAKVGVDYAVIETGLGGLHDATNLPVGPDKICVITDIGIDHTHVLGNTLREIAGQKAGIIHSGNRIFMYQQSPVVEIFENQATEKHAILNVLSNVEEQGGDAWNQLPQYQKRNWYLAKKVYDHITASDSLPSLSQQQIESSMQTQIIGRMDTKQVGDKTVIMDGAHNEQKIQAFVSSFQKLYPTQKAAILLSLKEGKEYEAVLPLLKPICSQLIITTFDTMKDLPLHSIDPNILATAATNAGFTNIQIISNTKDAYTELLQTSDALLLVTGSFYLISVVREF